MRVPGKFAVLAATVVVVCGFAQASPATASDAVDARAVAVQQPADSEATVTTQELGSRIDQLVSAYDQETKTFDSSKVSAEILASDEGRAFVAAVSLSESAETTSELEEAFVALRDQLLASGSPMTVEIDGSAAAMSFSLTPGATITYPTGLVSGGDGTGGIQPLVTGGADPWPYIQLTNAEQQAMVTGASGALVAAICALLAPTTAGVGCGVGAAVIAMIVGIIVANGVCANNREMRIYPLAGPTGFSCQ